MNVHYQNKTREKLLEYYKLRHNMSIADEASQEIFFNKDNQVLGVNQSMKVITINDKLVVDNMLQEVTNPIPYKKGSIPTDDGILSPVIFGTTPDQIARTHAYINLHRKFFHPYVFEQLLRINRNIGLVAKGEGSWIVDESGTLTQIKDKFSIDYDEDNTGLDWLIENFRKIKFKETEAATTKERIKLFENLSDDEIFITKWVVIPIKYRDSDNSSGKTSLHEINYMYNDIIANTRSLGDEILSITKRLTLYNIQTKLVELRKYGQSLIEKKNGVFQKSILGKTPDHGGRGVISVPSLNGCDLPSDCIVDITHSGIPLSYCITTGYPFMIKWITEFFEDTFRNKQTMPVYRKDKNGNIVLESVDIIDQTEIYTQDFIDKKLEMFIKTYGAERFETIKIRCKDGTDAEMMFPGKGYVANPEGAGANTISNRPMTWTDIIYLAAENTLSDKYCYITRYPLTDYFGTFPSQVAVLSTIKTMPVMINGKIYKHYPVVDLSLTPDQISRVFIDTISISNLYLDAIGGDYDGDTVSLKILYSIEANQEAKEALSNIKHYVSIQGDLIRVIGNESYLTFYNMTRRE